MDECNLVRLTKNFLPNVEISNIEVNDEGWDNNIIIVNKEIVLRLPKTEELLTKMLDEVKVLKCLRIRKPILKIPEYDLIYYKNRVKGVKYTFLEGKSLTECRMGNVSNNPENAKLLGEFLTKLHSINLSELNDTNLQQIHNRDYWKSLFLSTEKYIFPFIKNEDRIDITNFFTEFIDSNQTLSFRKCIIHGDLTTSNIIYNENKGRLEGVIDFTDCQIGDPAFDFAGLYWALGPKFTKDVLEWYETSECKDSIYSRVSNFYGLQPVFHNLLYMIKNNKIIDWDSSLSRFTELRKIRQ
ncbi:aminoglycoside phosphotransferase family protein [Sutcliffiella rhizosphaerae]|uniref:Aminoglycoside phosphotransferase domain-containing protein n=1 Tax=Sutcliffiella rhizosphaerae TaxID=2880967 RepID=A0ABN8ADL1_9BACI|nr:aminoglycoside phosphotransferase family protein [Sutcliffiella rhizosphaerae]CAG9623338.1 hypothetical protein BACCIP111883_04139 [Sutcliffiella rhizosphaerae]